MQKDYQKEYTIYKGCNFYYVVRHECEMSQLSLAQSFELGGTYVFGKFDDITVSDFYARLLGFLHNKNNQLAFIWIENPSVVASRWKYHSIYCLTKNANTWQLGNYAEFKFGAYHLALNGAMSISCQEGNMVFSTTETNDKSYRFRLSQINGMPTTDNFSLDFTEGRAGIFSFSVLLKGDGQSDVFDRMDACLKYAAPLGADVENSWKQGHVGIISSPVLHSTKDLKLLVQMNPASIYDQASTFMVLYNSTADNMFDSAFINVYGHFQRVQASANARLVFEKIPRYLYFDTKKEIYCGDQTYYLGFSGSFYLENAEKHILCGLSGTEFMDLSNVDLREIKFVPKQNSFFGEQKQQNLSTAAWISFPKNTKYFSQPEVAPMYSVNNQKMLRFLEIPTIQLDESAVAVPMAFYKESDVSFLESHSVEAIEWRIYGERYQLITGRVVEKEEETKFLRDSVCKKTVTPQGLMAGVVPNTGSYDWFGIAQTDETAQLPNIRFCNVSESLRMELQNSQLCLYKDDRDAFLCEAQPSGDFKVWVDDWCFLLSPEDWKINAKEKNTAFIVKYVKGKSLKELLQNSPIFQASLRATYDQQNIVFPEYKNFVNRVEDPDFQGIVFLNAMVSVSQIPKEVAFLLKGVKQEDFYAHHVILEGNKVVQGADGDLQMKQSSVEALIDYKKDNQIVYDENLPDYAFTTVEMTLSIENSVITHFSSVSEIFLNKLYGAVCTKTNTTSGNCMILDGISQKKQDEVEYVFSLREPGVYSLKSSAMEVVNLQSVQLAVDDGTGRNGRLTLSGQIQFSEIKECDLLSYQTLIFSNLQLIVPDTGTLHMEYDKLIVNYSASELRAQSFGKRFACDLDRIVYSEKQMPQDMNYQTITSPVKQSKLKMPWAGQIWNLSLGSLGNLSNSGEANIKLLIAWSMGESAPEYYVGVTLPSIMNGFDIQGIIRMGFQSVELMASKQGDIQNFTLRLHNYTLSLLWFAIPPGSNDLFIFSDGKKLSWYAAYVGEES
ncbi:MAG: hypothetical protein P4L69_02750 [Desulfosporosinus sp.]|nr:hypothetical protein [Desulfosporosinus sp.]